MAAAMPEARTASQAASVDAVVGSVDAVAGDGSGKAVLPEGTAG
jgi:hypothetical protein